MFLDLNQTGQRNRITNRPARFNTQLDGILDVLNGLFVSLTIGVTTGNKGAIRELNILIWIVFDNHRVLIIFHFSPT